MINLYMHAGSMNHGCEAIVRSTVDILNDRDVVLYSENKKEDIEVNLDDVCIVKSQGGNRKKNNPVFLLCKVLEVFIGAKPKLSYIYNKILSSMNEGEMWFSIGGDNYCYDNNRDLAFLNRQLNNKGCKTVLWGCSIEPKSLSDDKLLRDLKMYHAITTRESITYNALIESGIKENVYLFPDPAFCLKSESVELNRIFNNGNVIGINISPVVERNNSENSVVFNAYVHLIEWIIDNTELNVALIPHVVKKGNDDRESMKKIVQKISKRDRVFLVNEDGSMNCCQIKYVISKCRFLIAARTHASIAAYSTKVPTLVVGYSVKARGIAKDIFGSYDEFVIDSSVIVNKEDLLNKFIWIYENEVKIRAHLESFIPNYINQMSNISNCINKVINNDKKN